MDEVFRALADPTRRSLLDKLYEHDGQTLSALEQRLPMSRFGVMKHLKVLEAAGLVKTKRRGREKLHFLNPVPIRLVHDRWVSKYAEPWAKGLSDLKQRMEEPTMSTDTTHTDTDAGTTGDVDTRQSGKRPWTAEPTEKVFEIFIKTTPERLWEAIVDPELRRRYNFGAGASSDWTPGSHYELASGPMTLAEGENLEVDPPRRLVQSFTAVWSEEVRAEGTSRVTWEIERVEDSCRLTVTHDQLREHAHSELYGGWPMILSGLKTLLESGESLTTPGSLRYS
ncbi:MAG TPA: metalloregulator ArsR/SmtB family transcription factor [Solirubrobacteraceae bacterium]